MRLPDLTGRTVLDIGAYDGFYSFEAERRGAKDVLATDSWTWNWPGSDARRNFDPRAPGQHSAGAGRRRREARTRGGRRNVRRRAVPRRAVPRPRSTRVPEAGAQRDRRVAIIETVVDLLDVPVPAAAYYANASLNNDGSNHFGPNPMAVEGLLVDAGFGRVVAFDPWATNPWYSVPPAAEINPSTFVAASVSAAPSLRVASERSHGVPRACVRGQPDRSCGRIVVSCCVACP